MVFDNLVVLFPRSRWRSKQLLWRVSFYRSRLRAVIAIHAANAAVAGTSEASFKSNLGYSGEQWDSSLRMQKSPSESLRPKQRPFHRSRPLRRQHARPQSLHKYAYVHGDPVQGIDPTGEMNLSTTIGGISIGTILSTAMKGAIFAGTIGFYAGTADSLLGGKSFKQSIQDGAYTAVFAAAIGGILAPAWLLGIWGAGVVQATALSTAIIGQSGLVGIGIVETIDSIKQGKFTQAAFRGAFNTLARTTRGQGRRCRPASGTSGV